jgi:hypothetical protein
MSLALPHTTLNAEIVAGLALRMNYLGDEMARRLGGHHAEGRIHHVPRAAFDALPGREITYPAPGRTFYSKSYGAVQFYCDEAPVDAEWLAAS